MTFTWEFLELFTSNNKLIAVRYLLTGFDGVNKVRSEGNHYFLPETVNKSLENLVELDIIRWLEKDTTQNDVNPIKLAIENQLKSLETIQKIDLPWLTGTFTIE